MRRGSALLARGIAFACDWSLSHVRAILSSSPATAKSVYAPSAAPP
jgi:hypothetical protein